MKRLLLATVFWGAALLPLAAYAQRPMGGRMSAPPRVSSGIAARPSPTARFAAAPTGFSQVRPVPFRGPVLLPNQRAFFPRRNAFVHFRSFPRRPLFSSNVCFNGGFGGPFFCGGTGFINTRVGFNSGFTYAPYPPEYAYGYPSAPPQPVYVDDSNSRELSLQVERLSDEVETMRDEERRRDENRPASQPQSKPAAQDDSPNAVLIFRDGRQLSVRNYAVVGNTVWVLSEHAANKFAVSDLDINATEQANAKNGVEFRLPGMQSH